MDNVKLDIEALRRPHYRPYPVESTLRKKAFNSNAIDVKPCSKKERKILKHKEQNYVFPLKLMIDIMVRIIFNTRGLRSGNT